MTFINIIIKKIKIAKIKIFGRIIFSGIWLEESSQRTMLKYLLASRLIYTGYKVKKWVELDHKNTANKTISFTEG